MDLLGVEKIGVYSTTVVQKPLVSVCIQTYKHDAYIKECLDSILMQQTDFEFEILLGEDDSPDKTRQICKEYADKHPDKIRLFLHDRSNVIYINGMATGRYNFIYNLNNTRGKYIALCEGDDFWTDPLKLQKQVDFLEANEDFAMVFHNAKMMKDRQLTEECFLESKKDQAFTLVDSLNPYKRFAPTASVLFRNCLPKPMPSWFRNGVFGDRQTFSMIAKHGKCMYQNEVSSVYRIHSGGVSQKFNLESDLINRISFFDNMMHYLDDKQALSYCRRYQKFYYKVLLHKMILGQLTTIDNPSLFKCFKMLFGAKFISFLFVREIAKPNERSVGDGRIFLTFLKQLLKKALKPLT